MPREQIRHRQQVGHIIFETHFQKKRIREQNRLARLIAEEVRSHLAGGYDKFLPPVTLRDSIYMLTESGSVYRLDCHEPGMEQIVQIIRR